MAMAFNSTQIVDFRLTLEVCALNPVWDISISKEEVKLPVVAEEIDTHE